MRDLIRKLIYDRIFFCIRLEDCDPVFDRNREMGRISRIRSSIYNRIGV